MHTHCHVQILMKNRNSWWFFIDIDTMWLITFQNYYDSHIVTFGHEPHVHMHATCLVDSILKPYDHVSKIYTPISLVYPSDPICPCNWDVMISLPKSWCPCQGPTYSQVSFSIGDTWGPWSSDDSMHMLAPSTGNLSYLDPLIARVVLGALWYQLLLPTLIVLLIQ